MSYQIKIDPRASKAGRFIGLVHRELQKAFVDSGLKQNDLATKLDVDRSLVNRQLQGKANLTLRTISDLAWAMDCDVQFSLCRQPQGNTTNAFGTQITSGYHIIEKGPPPFRTATITNDKPSLADA